MFSTEMILRKNLSGLKSFLKHYKKVLLNQFAMRFPNTASRTEPTINNFDKILGQHKYATNQLYYMYIYIFI